MRLLVVEDDAKIASFVVRGLKEAGFAVDHAPDGEQGLLLASTTDYDAAVVDRGYLGVSVQDITPALAETFGLKSRSGALVSDVQPDSPASKAGLKSGDVITSIAGKPVQDAAQLSLAVSQTAPDTEIRMEVLREGRRKTLEATTAPQPDARPRLGMKGEGRGLSSGTARDEGVLNGVAVVDLDAQTRRQLSLPAKLRGALVTSVAPDSASAKAGLQPGDVILEINRKTVQGAEDAVKLTESSESKRTLVKLWSRGGTVFTVVDERQEAQS